MTRRDSSLRDAFVGILMTVGPFFGVRYQPPRVEVPVVTTPGDETDSAAGLTGAPRADVRSREAGEDGVVI